jgi:hypothetical protein
VSSHPFLEVFEMRKLSAKLAALAAAPIVVFAAMQTAAPALADTPGVSPTCFPQSVNPHPTDPAGSTTATLFCTAPTPTSSPTAGTGTTSGGSAGRSGSRGSGVSGAGTTGGGSQTTLANSPDSGTPDESSHVTSGSGGANTGSSANGTSSGRGFFAGLVGFFSATGGLVFLFGLLVLMAIVLVAVGFATWLRRGQAGSWASRARSLSFRPKS